MTQRVHVSLPVRDLNDSMRFYERLLGAPPSKVRDDYANFRLDSPPIHLALVASSASDADRPASRHHGIELPEPSHLASWRQRARSTGLEITEETDSTCCYARGDKLWARDPDGNAWEIWVRTDEAEVLRDPSTTCCT